MIALFDALHLHRAAKLLRAVEPLGPRERLEFLLARAPNRIVPFLLAHRYIALIVLINTAAEMVIANWRNSSPVIPPMKALGTNTASKTSVVAITGPVISSIALNAESLGLRPFAR